jgi:S1-C subfamily serine protease
MEIATTLRNAGIGIVLLGFAAGLFAQEESSLSLDEAKRNLEQAAREVARLSAELAGPVVQNLEDLDIRIGNFGRRARLGISIEDVDSGVLVAGVTPGSGAAEAGILTGDIIVAIDGAELGESGGASPSELLMAQMVVVEPGSSVPLRVLRAGDTQELIVRAEPVQRQTVFLGDAAEARGPFNFARPAFPIMFGRPFRALELVSLTPGLGAYFGTEEGLLVVRAPEDEALQLRDGDVILDIGGRAPMSPEHAMRILGSFDPGETLRLQIMRRERRETLELVMPERSRRN